MESRLENPADRRAEPGLERSDGPASITGDGVYGSPPSRGRPGWFFGPLTRFGVIVAFIVCAIDQAAKLSLLNAFDLANRGIVHLTPFLDLVLTWNTGISYGLFPQESDFGRYVLLALKAGAVVILWVWLARSELRLTALALGLIIGGAVGHSIDRLDSGGVMAIVG